MKSLTVILTSLLSAVALFFITKIMGHKQMTDLDFFDYINGITIGSIAAELATELENPEKPLIAMAIYGIISVTLSMITHKFPKTRKFINGTPTILLHDGKLSRDNMKKANLDLSEFMLMCREAGYFDLNQIRTAIFEHNGKLTVLPKSTERPLTPSDMGITPKAQGICTELIMDGRIMSENLKRRGLDESWLTRELDKKGYKSSKEIYLGLCDDENKLTLFPID